MKLVHTLEQSTLVDEGFICFNVPAEGKSHSPRLGLSGLQVRQQGAHGRERRAAAATGRPQLGGHADAALQPGIGAGRRRRPQQQRQLERQRAGRVRPADAERGAAQRDREGAGVRRHPLHLGGAAGGARQPRVVARFDHRLDEAPRAPRPLARLEAEDTQVPIHRVQEGLHEELASEGAPKNTHRYLRSSFQLHL